MASQSNLKHLKFTAALAPKSLSRACATLVVCLIANGFGTANADVISVTSALIIGFIAGVIVVFSIISLDKAKIDDPVGAISVHGVCGIWGTIATAIFADGFDFMVQLKGALLVSVFAFAFAYIVFSILKIAMGVRVSEEEEDRGLDIAEHGQEAYGS